MLAPYYEGYQNVTRHPYEEQGRECKGGNSQGRRAEDLLDRTARDVAWIVAGTCTVVRHFHYYGVAFSPPLMLELVTSVRVKNRVNSTFRILKICNSIQFWQREYMLRCLSRVSTDNLV